MALKEKPDKKFYVAFDFYKIDNYHFHDRSYHPISAVDKTQHIYMPQINHISNILPHAPPLTQLEDLEKVIYRVSYMSAHVFWKSFNSLGKRDKMRGLSSILSLFRNEFNKFNNTRAWMLDSIYIYIYIINNSI